MYLFSDELLNTSGSFDVPHVIVLQSTKVNVPVDEIVKRVGNGLLEAETLIKNSKTFNYRECLNIYNAHSYQRVLTLSSPDIPKGKVVKESGRSKHIMFKYI